MSNLLQLIDDYGNAALRAGASNGGYVINMACEQDWEKMRLYRQRLRAEIERLQAVVDAVKKYAELKTTTEGPTLEQWAAYEDEWKKVMQAIQLAIEAEGENNA